MYLKLFHGISLNTNLLRREAERGRVEDGGGGGGGGVAAKFEKQTKKKTANMVEDNMKTHTNSFRKPIIDKIDGVG